MDLDSVLVEYMKERAELAKHAACMVAVQCFAIAVFFCSYGLIKSYYAEGTQIGAAQYGAIALAIVISILLSIFNVLVCIRYRRILLKRPDDIALRQSHDTVKQAYGLARPILIWKITLSIAIMLAGGLAYILIVILMDRSGNAGIYGRVVVFVCMAIAIFVGLPCVDRIQAYRYMLNEIHLFSGKGNGAYYFAMVASVGVPASICAWFILRSFTEKRDIAWIVFPMVAVFGLAIAYLIGWTKDLPPLQTEEDIQS